MTAPRHMFVYGTLRPSLGHPAAARLVGRTGAPVDATVAGKLVDLGPYPGFLPVFSPGSDDRRVHGELVAIDAAHSDGLLRELDSYEGAEYRRDVVLARTDDGSTVDAWIYVLVRVPATARPVASGDWARRAPAS